LISQLRTAWERAFRCPRVDAAPVEGDVCTTKRDPPCAAPGSICRMNPQVFLASELAGRRGAH